MVLIASMFMQETIKIAKASTHLYYLNNANQLQSAGGEKTTFLSANRLAVSVIGSPAAAAAMAKVVRQC